MKNSNITSGELGRKSINLVDYNIVYKFVEDNYGNVLNMPNECTVIMPWLDNGKFIFKELSTNFIWESGFDYWMKEFAVKLCKLGFAEKIVEYNKNSNPNDYKQFVSDFNDLFGLTI